MEKKIKTNEVEAENISEKIEKKKKIIRKIKKAEPIDALFKKKNSSKKSHVEKKHFDVEEKIIALEKSAESIIFREKNKKNIGAGLVIAAVLILIGASAFFYVNQKEKKKNVVMETEKKENSAKNEIQQIVEVIGKFMELPTEEPILATVTDIEKVKTQKFFTNAQNGDKVLIYSKSQKAILYRPATNKIVEVSQVSGMENGQEVSQGESVNPQNDSINQSSNEKAQETSENNVSTGNIQANISATVSVYNGSKIKGLARTIGEKLSQMTGLTVKDKINAAGNYEKTLVIDISGTNEELAKKIAEDLNGEVGFLPSEEKKPESDILVIGGSDFE